MMKLWFNMASADIITSNKLEVYDLGDMAVSGGSYLHQLIGEHWLIAFPIPVVH